MSGWEVQDEYTLPSVQLGAGKMLITTRPIYDGQGKVKSKAQVIAVDVASGEWLSQDEIEEGFAYLDGEQVRVFVWKAEGEMPYVSNPEVSVQNGEILTKDFGLVCRNQQCDRIPVDGKILGWERKIYTLSHSEVTGRWEVRKQDGQLLATFMAPENAYLDVGVFNDVVVVEVSVGRSAHVTAYREDGRRAEIASNFVLCALADNNRIAFGIYKEGLKILDIGQWAVRQYGKDAICYIFQKVKLMLQSRVGMMVVHLSKCLTFQQDNRMTFPFSGGFLIRQ